MNISRLLICIVGVNVSVGCVVEPAPRPVQVISATSPAPEVDKPLPSTPIRIAAPAVPPPMNPPGALPDPP